VEMARAQETAVQGSKTSCGRGLRFSFVELAVVLEGVRVSSCRWFGD
jgi:hypothetical protein